MGARAVTHRGRTRCVSVAATNVAGVTEPGDTVRGTIASSERPKRSRVSIADLTVLVRVPGHPAAVQAFTDNERTAAQRFADEVGGAVETLR